MNKEIFAKAIAKVLIRYVQRDIKTVDITDLWLDTSIPKDLIVELLNENSVPIPEGLEKIKDGKKIVWRRT